jgi:LacI family transcriptional regulator
VLATLYQRPEAQGKLAFESLIAHVMNKDKPVRTHRFAPHIILRSNLSLFVNRLIPATAKVAS